MSEQTIKVVTKPRPKAAGKRRAKNRTFPMAFYSPFFRTTALVTGFALVAGASAVRSDLGQEPSVTEGLIAVAIAYEIGERCDSINARVLQGLAYLNQLKGEARALGYSDDEINAFVDNRAEQDRLEGIARQRLAGFGAVSGQWDTYCTVGNAQMAEGTVTGQLLR